MNRNNMIIFMQTETHQTINQLLVVPIRVHLVLNSWTIKPNNKLIIIITIKTIINTALKLLKFAIMSHASIRTKRINDNLKNLLIESRLKVNFWSIDWFKIKLLEFFLKLYKAYNPVYKNKTPTKSQ